MEEREIKFWLVVIVSVVIYLTRNTNTFSQKAWVVLKAFYTALLLVLAYGFVKDQFKKK